jgi:hypothetical protein
VYAADDDCTKLDGAGARQLAAVLIEAADEIGPARATLPLNIKRLVASLWRAARFGSCLINQTTALVGAIG